MWIAKHQQEIILEKKHESELFSDFYLSIKGKEIDE